MREHPYFSLAKGDAMSVAFFIVTEQPVEGLDTFVDGKALAHCRPAGVKARGGRQADRHLEALAREAGVKPFMEFFSESPENIRELLDEVEVEAPDVEMPPEQWFSAAEGLATVRGLLSHLTAHPEATADAEHVLEDLRQFETVLSQLDAAGVRWHLAVDF